MRTKTQNLEKPMVNTIIDQFGQDPFLILISCLLSLRAKDTVTLSISLTLFNQAKTPQELLKLSQEELQKLLYPLGFYHRKSAILHEVSRELLDRFDGKVPKAREELLSLSGVGPKTANLVLGLGFGVAAICVDTHVHRLSNHLDLVKTRTPEETEVALEVVLPKKHWIEWSRLLILWGQNVCKPNLKRCRCYILFE